MGSMSTASRCVATLAVLLSLSGCGTMSDTCRARVSSCLERCEAATPDTGEPAKSNTGDTTLTECEKRCQCNQPDPPREPMGEVTPTS